MSDYQFVLPRVAVGSAIGNSQEFVDALKSSGITLVVDCQGEFDDSPFCVPQGLKVVWCPTSDDGQPKSLDWWALGVVSSFQEYSNPHTKIFFHCAAGVNRGPSMCFGFLLALGFDSVTAEALIRAVRPQVGLAYKADAIVKVPQLGY